VDTSIGYLFEKVNAEAQVNEVVFLQEDKCVVDCTKLLVANEQKLQIPPKFPDNVVNLALTANAETLLREVLAFEAEGST
jgi:hypothetical protein